MDLLDGLKAFVATAQNGSFTAGAERLGISNRLVSKYIAELEDRLGVRLLQRTTRTVGLTSAGEDLLARAPALIEDFDCLVNDLSERSAHLTGTIRVTAPIEFGGAYIRNMLSRFALKHPELSIDLQLDDNRVDLAAQGVDVAFRIGDPDLQSQRIRKLGMIRTVLVASPDYIARQGSPLSPADIAGHSCIIDTNRRNPLHWSFTREGRSEDVRVRGRISVNGARLAAQFAVDGFGIALCPHFSVDDDILAGRLVTLLNGYRSADFELNIIYLGGRTVPRKLRALIDFVVEDVGRATVL